ncbi:integrase catalytic domain-containing protein [Nephila pilipes]|uniref:Integrase catalytic domain-containing protein n=1 Tax=Nephila pilipes TaxID=299642 RepID=A0A8X6T5E9_NEPPI|nr:integrase catalytic domain-containing protein [Nephila pilipes]
MTKSRPLIHLSEDPEEFSITLSLSLSMLFQEIKEFGVPDFKVIHFKKLEKVFIYRMKILQDLRNKYRNHYLVLLKDYSKVYKELLIREDIVLISDNNVKRINRFLAKVEKIYPDKDDSVHAVKSEGTVWQLHQIYPLPIVSQHM